MEHLTREQLEAGLDHVLMSPKGSGTVELIVRRPDFDEREVLEIGELHLDDGLVGDNWKIRGSNRTEDGSSHPDMQLNIMNSRCVALVAQDPDRWALAGDQLFVDLDLAKANLPAGTRLSLGTAIIEVTEQPHRGCGKFTRRFGLDAHRFVNSERGRELCLRGINARVVQPGMVRRGDTISKL
ncbi:MAG: MOSC domain-containing protein [Actinomycetota bacterium]